MSSLNEISRLLLDRYFKDDMNGFPPPRIVPSAVVNIVQFRLLTPSEKSTYV